MNTELTDLSPMPFGKYKNKPMQDVPASYLHWLWTEMKDTGKRGDVYDYIQKNMPALKKEYQDGVW